MVMLTLTQYVIRYDPHFKGWVAFKVVTEHRGTRVKQIEKTAMTRPKKAPHLAVRSLLRIMQPHHEVTTNNATRYDVLDTEHGTPRES